MIKTTIIILACLGGYALFTTDIGSEIIECLGDVVNKIDVDKLGEALKNLYSVISDMF